MRTSLLVAGVLAAGFNVAAHAEGNGSLRTAARETKPIFDLRLRTENVDQDGIADDAHATTLRARLGFETGKAWNTSLLVEGEGIVPIQDDYRPDPARPAQTTYPVVPDDEGYELNRLQLTNTSLPGTTLTLGRQRILLDDQRFVGNSGWRQNEQTFDALRMVNKSVENLVLDATYLNRVNRVNGPESPQGAYEGDSVLLNAGYRTRIGRITAFGYLLDFEPIANVPQALNPVRDAASTYGLRLAGEKPAGKARIAYAVSYAEQTDYGDNPLDFDLGYLFAELNVAVKQYGFGLGAEIFEGNGAKGFITPLATLHKFNGWSDKFVATPADGLEDLYATASVSLKKAGVFDTLGVVLSYHDYQTERTAVDFGDELNLSVAAKIKKVGVMLKYADYQEGEAGSPRDTQKLWAQVEFVW